MAKTPKLNLNYTPAAELTKRFIDFRTELAGEDADSNMMILDTKVGEIIDKLAAYDGQPFTWGMVKNGLGNTQ